MATCTAIRMEFRKALKLYHSIFFFSSLMMNLHKVKWKPLSCWLLVQIIQSNFVACCALFTHVRSQSFMCAVHISCCCSTSNWILSSRESFLSFCFERLAAQITDCIRMLHMRVDACGNAVLESLFNLLRAADDQGTFSIGSSKNYG